jgi:alpha-beta hydrolase superfamily lysophospholipase
MIEETFTARDGTHLFLRRSRFTGERRLLVLHGLFEYSVNYPQLIKRIFPEGGVEWAAFDMRGHGLSEGIKNEVNPEVYAKDVKDLVKHLGWADGSFVALGHSFGGLMALYLSGKEPRFLKALLLSSPFFGMPDSRNSIEVFGLLTLAVILPGYRLQNAVSTQDLTHDEKRVRQYETDPLIHRSISLGSLKNIRKMQKAVSRLVNLPIPLLIFVGGEEKVVSRRAIDTWTQNYRGASLGKKEFLGFYHEVFNELNNESVILEAREFLKKVL